MKNLSTDEVKSREDKDILYALMSLGLSRELSEVYITLVKFGEGGAYEIFRSSTVKRQRVYSKLRRLEEMGMAELLSERPIRYRAVPPNEVFKEKIEEMKKTLKDLEYGLEILQSKWKSKIPVKRQIRYVAPGVRMEQAILALKKMGGVNEENIKNLNRADLISVGLIIPCRMGINKLRKRLLKKLEEGKL